MKKYFTVEQMKDAFMAIQNSASEKQMAMLQEHYLNVTLSMQTIAEAGGYSSHKAGNSQYGGLCGKIARHLAFESSGDQTFVIATVLDGQWKMDKVARTALRELGWFENED